MSTEPLSAFVDSVPDFPAPGILCRDMSPLLADPGAFAQATQQMSEQHRGTVDLVAGIDARGFIFATSIAVALGVGMIPIRKAGKLPPETLGASYDLEYGTDTLEIRASALGAGQRVLVVDDVLATGGTAAAAVTLMTTSGASVVGVEFLIEIESLDGRKKLGNTPVHSVLKY